MVNLIEIPFTPERLANTVFIITVDLSKPGSVLAHLQFWINTIREKCQGVFDKIKVGKDKIETKANKVWEGHEDSSRVFPFMFPVLIVGTKYDVFKVHESEPMKWMCRALRYFAHQNGCSLVFNSGTGIKSETW